jgi:bacterioferritin
MDNGKEAMTMGTKGREIVRTDVSKLIELLNRAFADEWLSHYQYWVGAKVTKGPMRGALVAELEEHAKDELKHAGMLAERIIQLGGTPLLKPEDWSGKTNCGYDAPEDPSVRSVLEQNLKGERCAIGVYQDLAQTLRDDDSVTSRMVLEILEDEVEHEEDLEALLEDMRMMERR